MPWRFSAQLKTEWPQRQNRHTYKAKYSRHPYNLFTCYTCPRWCTLSLRSPVSKDGGGAQTIGPPRLQWRDLVAMFQLRRSKGMREGPYFKSGRRPLEFCLAEGVASGVRH